MTGTTLDAVAAVVSGLLGGGLITGVVALYRAKKLAGPERDSYIATANHDTVAGMQILLNEEQQKSAKLEARVAELEAGRKADAEQISALGRQLAAMQAQLSDMRAQYEQLQARHKVEP